MWFLLSLGALLLLVLRRTTEKNLTGKIDSNHLSWLQQFFGMPFILITLLFAPFYMPSQLSGHFWFLMAIYAVCVSFDVWCYFKALGLADISFVAPLLSLVAIGNSIGAVFVLHQPLTGWGIIGGASIIVGAYLTNRGKKRSTDLGVHHNNRKALLYILALVVVRAYFSNIEVFMIRESNPTTFNFYSSVLSIPILFFVAALMHKVKQTTSLRRTIKNAMSTNLLALLFVGATYAFNMIMTYQAKLLSPNAGYVGAVKSSQVLPMMLIGMFLFNEKIVRLQWYGLGIICFGLFCMSMN